jgi:hypothetical protein
LANLHEVLYGVDDIEYYLDYVVLNPVALTIPKWWVWVKICMEMMTEDNLDSILLNAVASTTPKWRSFNVPGVCNFELIGGFG